MRALAANAQISEARWRQVVKGTQPGPEGMPIPARASDKVLARMAIAAGVTPGQLEEAGREDAADLQRLMLNNRATAAAATTAAGVDDADEIEMVARSEMPTRWKLETIRTILRLRAQLEAEERQAREEASAVDAEASVEQQS